MKIQDVKDKLNQYESNKQKLKTLIAIKYIAGINLYKAKHITDTYFNKNRKPNAKKLGTEIMEYFKYDWSNVKRNIRKLNKEDI